MKSFTEVLEPPTGGFLSLPKGKGRRRRSSGGPNRSPRVQKSREDIRAEEAAMAARSVMLPIVVARELVAEYMPLAAVLLQELHRLNELEKLGAVLDPLLDISEEDKEALIPMCFCHMIELGFEQVEKMVDEGRWAAEIEKQLPVFRSTL